MHMHSSSQLESCFSSFAFAESSSVYVPVNRPVWIAVPVLHFTAFDLVLAFMPVFRLVWTASHFFLVSVCFDCIFWGRTYFCRISQVPRLGLPFAVSLEQCLFVSSVFWQFDLFVFRFVCLLLRFPGELWRAGTPSFRAVRCFVTD